LSERGIHERAASYSPADVTAVPSCLREYRNEFLRDAVEWQSGFAWRYRHTAGIRFDLSPFDKEIRITYPLTINLHPERLLVVCNPWSGATLIGQH
jgi:hypothetical protein